MRLADEHAARNEFFEAEVDPQTGGLRAIRDPRTRVSRLGQQLVFNPGATMRVQQIHTTSQGPALGEIISEGVLLAKKGGIDPALAVDVLTQSGVGSPMLKGRGPFVLGLPEQALFDVSMMRKDLRLALEAAGTLDVPLPTASVAKQLFTAAKAMGYEKQKDGSLAVRIEIGGKQETIVTDVVLVAVGMRPVSKGIGLEQVGVTIDTRGFVPTDKSGRTNIPSIYAIGDVSGPPLRWFESSAAYLGERLERKRPLVVGIFTDTPATMINAIADKAAARDYLLRSSMIASMRHAAAIK